MGKVASNIDNIIESIEADAIPGMYPIVFATQALTEPQAVARPRPLHTIREQI